MKRVFLGLLALLVIAAALAYLREPVFWQRSWHTLSSPGQGAYSAVFDVQAEVRASDSPLSLPVAGPGQRTIADSALQAMADYAAAFDSFALIVLHRGVVQLAWYREGYDRESLTQSQSMHKSLQALLVGIAVQQGLIDGVQQPIGRYLPELAGDPRGEVAIRDYLTMSSGLRPFPGGFNPLGEAFRWLYARDLDAATLAVEQARPAGEAFEYHDADTQLLGMMLTRVFGRPYVEYLREQLWSPMGGEQAFAWLDSEGGVAHHNCCLLARAEDWAKIGLMIQNRGLINGRQVVSPAWLEAQLAPALTPHYGYQTWLASNAEPNPRAGGGGYRRDEDWLAGDVVFFSGYGAQRVYISRERELVIVRLGPAAGYFPKIVEQWDNSFLFNTAVRAIIQ